MFFVLSKTISVLLMPLSMVVIFMLLSFFVRRTIWRKRFRMVWIVLFFLFTNPLIIRYLFLWWEIPPIPYAAINQKYEYAVVLTGMTNLDGKPGDRVHFSHAVDRILQGMALYRKGLAEKILITGGTGSLVEPDLKEAPKLAAFLHTMGIPDSIVIVESESRNTYENAKFTKDWFNDHDDNPQGILLVTSAFHMRRSLACFEKQGLTMQPFSVDYSKETFHWTPGEIIIPSYHALEKWHILVKEWMGMIAYWLAGYI